eukprot:CAMPEP_0179035028 /NCGR_PEP_ID=MMETSP0796-20121207/12905_1 /TAXON_ID=73915 /ORGANISM="Pyrodinium bahamense, Strain pbaha01" /LENGTH=376 /DNA_ID=CAMNT_0020731299 /DNA_START=188 /DNA_END=1314 /DNA_ORIENTATION=-
MLIDRADACASERIFIDPYGLPHKRIGYVQIPAVLLASDIAALRETWKPRNGSRLVVVPVGIEPPDTDGLGLLVALAEQWSPGAIRAESILLNQLPDQCSRRNFAKVLVTGDEIQVPQQHPLIDRCLECRAACTHDPVDHRCFLTWLPPSLIPASTLQGSGRRHERWADVDTEDESDCGVPEGGAKVVVICADPRYLVMQEYMLLKQLRDFYQMETGSNEPLEVVRFLELGLQASLIQSLKILTEWASEEQRRPSQVKLFLIEEFVSEPDVALLSLARFLGVQDGSDVLQTVVEEMEAFVQQSRGLFARCPEGVSEAQLMRSLAQQFEHQLDAAPPGVAAAWREQVSELVRIKSPWALTPGLMLQPPSLWAAHSAG